MRYEAPTYAAAPLTFSPSHPEIAGGWYNARDC
jgi:hypothetical protein